MITTVLGILAVFCAGISSFALALLLVLWIGGKFFPDSLALVWYASYFALAVGAIVGLATMVVAL